MHLILKLLSKLAVCSRWST